MRHSGWFPGEIKPVHIGVYERDIDTVQLSAKAYSKWNGKHWCAAYTSMKSAEDNNIKSIFQLAEWRGVLRDKNGELLK
jgi:hypothetical protein